VYDLGGCLAVFPAGLVEDEWPSFGVMIGNVFFGCLFRLIFCIMIVVMGGG
jgi:hypothetical protein